MPLPFIKMHGLGNDFVILDVRQKPVHITEPLIRRIADRHRGVGCDQFVVLEKPRDANSDVFMAIYNSDGGRAGVCGNATRCVATLEMARLKKPSVTIDTDAGLLTAQHTDTMISVDMGPAHLDWQDIPMAMDTNTLAVDTGKTGLPLAIAVSMGNPHAVFFMHDIEGIDLAGIGPQIEHHPLFPQRTNVEIAQILSPTKIRMRAWERGAGITQACGSGACATLVAAVRRQLTERRAEIILDGGSLFVEWLENGHVLLSGPAAHAFTGEISDQLLEAA